MNNNNLGFTLAEVLITLAIIGIVAAMTILTLVSSYDKQVKANKVKKMYSVLQNMTNMSVADNGNISNWYSEEIYSGGHTALVNAFKQYFAPYLKITKYCESDVNVYSGYKLCGYRENYIYTKNGIASLSVTENDSVVVVLNDGSLLKFRAIKENLSANPDIYLPVYHWNVYFDVNGPKGKNTFGDDIFTFQLNPYLNRISLAGYYMSVSDHRLRSKDLIDEECTTIGLYCAAKIMLDGWKIEY